MGKKSNKKSHLVHVGVEKKKDNSKCYKRNVHLIECNTCIYFCHFEKTKDLLLMLLCDILKKMLESYVFRELPSQI